jgi:hypothetical protein
MQNLAHSVPMYIKKIEQEICIGPVSKIQNLVSGLGAGKFCLPI